MARSKQRTRKRKRRGTQGGAVKQAARSRGGARTRSAPKTAEQRRQERLSRPPSWPRALGMGAVTAGFLLVVFILLFKRETGPSLQFAVMSMALYVPVFYLLDGFKYKRYQRQQQQARERPDDEGA
jgi:hypothetical protein